MQKKIQKNYFVKYCQGFISNLILKIRNLSAVNTPTGTDLMKKLCI